MFFIFTTLFYIDILYIVVYKVHNTENIYAERKKAMSENNELRIYDSIKPLDAPALIAPVLSYDGEDILVKGALSYFIRDFEKTYGLKIDICGFSRGGVHLLRRKPGEIKLSRPSVFEECAAENYRIVYEDGVLTLEFIGIKGLNHALSALLSRGSAAGGQLLWDCAEIIDGPQCKYRSLLVDLGKNFHPVEYLFEYVDLCFKNNLSHFQVHFNDNVCYCLPSKLYPELATKDMHYTFDDIRRLNKYALRRGVSLVPEIDIPGHCKAFQNAYPELFGDDGVISMHADSMAAVRALIGEISDMFPYSEYFHIGGDEADILKWTECEKCLEYFETVDKAAVDSFRESGDGRALAERMLAGFVTECADAVKENGKKPIVWEGFDKSVNDYVSKDIIVMSWENYYQSTYELLDAGFDIINCAWNPLYIVTPKKMWSPDEILDWNIYKWGAIHPDSPYCNKMFEIDRSYKKRILGAQLHAWGDRILRDFPDPHDGHEEEKNNVAQRLPAFSVNVWSTPEQKEAFLNK